MGVSLINHPGGGYPHLWKAPFISGEVESQPLTIAQVAESQGHTMPGGSVVEIDGDRPCLVVGLNGRVWYGFVWGTSYR